MRQEIDMLYKKTLLTGTSPMSNSMATKNPELPRLLLDLRAEAKDIRVTPKDVITAMQMKIPTTKQ